MSGHLSSKTMDRLLAGGAAEAEAQHLNACADCAREVAALRQLLGAVRWNATEVAESQLVIAERHWTATEKPRAFSAKTFGSTGSLWAACAVVVLAIGVPLEVHRHEAVVVTTPVAQVRSAPVPVETSATDAALLEDIQNDLSTSVPQPLEPLAVTSRGSTNSNAAGAKNSNE